MEVVLALERLFLLDSFQAQPVKATAAAESEGLTELRFAMQLVSSTHSDLMPVCRCLKLQRYKKN